MTFPGKRFLAIGSMLFLVCVSFLPVVRAAEVKLFPDLEGWKQGDISSYGPDNLYVPIDGAADLFLRYNFEEMKSVEYSNGTDSFTIEAYRQASTLDAYGIFSQGMPAKEVYIDIGVRAYVEADLLNFLAGRHYAEMRTSTPNEKTFAAMKTVARLMAGALNEGATVPRFFDCFPVQGRKPHSEKYIARDILGYDFLRHAFQVEYESAGSAYTVYAMRSEKNEEAAAMLQAYFDQHKISPVITEDGFVQVDDKYHGTISFLRTGRTLLCLSGKPPAGSAKNILVDLKNQIQKAKE